MSRTQPDENTESGDSIERTTIPVSTDVRDELFDRKERSTDSYDDVLRRTLDL